MLEFINTGNKKTLTIFIVIAALLASAIAGYLYWEHKKSPDPVVGTSQIKAETPAGAKQAAAAAGVTLGNAQSEEVAAEVAKASERKPDSVVEATPASAWDEMRRQSAKSGADYSMITNPQKPDAIVQKKDLENLPQGSTISLNQYNIKAYPKNQITWSVFPSVENGKVSVGAVNLAQVNRWSKDGIYFGPAVSWDKDRKSSKVRVGLAGAF